MLPEIKYFILRTILIVCSKENDMSHQKTHVVLQVGREGFEPPTNRL